MNNNIIPVTSTSMVYSSPILVQAEPQSLEIYWRRTAVLVVDMQNAFVSKGGMWDLRGLNFLGGQKIIGPIREISNTVRKKGGKVVYAVTVNSPDLRESGGPNSPNWYKGVMTAYHEHPEWKDILLTRDTWGSAIVTELQPMEGDIVVEKHRYSAFWGTSLDNILRTYDIKYLLFVGVATNICIETSIRDAYTLDYFPILVSDAVSNRGPSYTQEATIYNTICCFGWVTSSENVIKGALNT